MPTRFSASPGLIASSCRRKSSAEGEPAASSDFASTRTASTFLGSSASATRPSKIAWFKSPRAEASSARRTCRRPLQW